jgi:hypothetical protein
MKRLRIRVWSSDVMCRDMPVRVYFSLPDTFYDVVLFSCSACSAIIAVDREREQYSGKKFDDLRATLNCPSCSESLISAFEYPQTFRCPDGSLGHFETPSVYPPDSDLIELEVWDPYG